jgi:O-methyltransferase
MQSNIANPTSPNELNITLTFPLPDGRTLVPGPLKYAADGLFTRHYAEFVNEPRFARAYEAGISTIRPHRPHINIAWRVHVMLWAASQAVRLEGDFVECGVFTGIYARSIIEYLDFSAKKEKTFWLLDTFSGIPAESLAATEQQRTAPPEYHDCYNEVLATFRPFSNVRVVKGIVPNTLNEVKSDKVALLSIDMNAAKPEIAAAEFFWDKLVPGAFMVLDDYGWRTCEAQREAFDQFAKRKQVEILCLPTGQGLIMKPSLK